MNFPESETLFDQFTEGLVSIIKTLDPLVK